jgi:signal transduction histidine kinase
MIALLIALGAVIFGVAFVPLAYPTVRAHPRDEFTGDPRVRDIWEKSRRERHGLIRSMWGDPWAEASWLSRVGRVLSHGVLWVIGVPFMWAALVMTSFFATAIFLTFYDEKAPVEQYLGRGFDGGVGDWIIGGSLLLSILLTTFAVWGKEATRESDIRRLRGLSCTDLLREHDTWREEQARLAEARRRRAEMDYLAERIASEMKRDR